MPAWINRTLVQAPRNGTATHTVAFTPASAGSLLVCVCEGAVTSTTPAGWTLPSGGSAVNNTGLYVWWKIAAAGEASLSTTHNGSDYAVGFVIYEYASGSSFVKSVSAVNVGLTAANPNLTGLTGTNTTFAAVGAPGIVNPDGTESVVWSGTPTPTGDVGYFINKTATDGYMLSVAYADLNTGTSWQPTGSLTTSESTPNKEALTFAVNAVAGSSGTPASVAATAATATARAFAASISGGPGKTNVGAKASTATAALQPPAVIGATTISGGGPATASAGAKAPLVQAFRVATVAAVAMRASALSPAPTVQDLKAATVAPSAMGAVSAALAPMVTGNRAASVRVSAATATAAAAPPTAAGFHAAMVQAAAATATALMPAPFITTGGMALVQASTMGAVGAANGPTVTAGRTVSISVPPATGVAAFPTPTFGLQAEALVRPFPGSAAAQMAPPTVSMGVHITAPIIAATAALPAPSVTNGGHVSTTPDGELVAYLIPSNRVVAYLVPRKAGP